MRRSRASTAVCLIAAALLAASAAAEEPPKPELPQPEQAPVLIQPTAIGDIEYRPGRGIKLADTGVTIGGFATLNGSRIEGERGRFQVDGLDLFVFVDPTAYLHAFADATFDKLFEIDESGADDESGAHVFMERLYGDLNLSDRANFRLGKFFTPVGRWNQVPAEPLTWTTSRPIVTDGPFDDRETGGTFWGSLFPSSGSLTYTLHGQFLPPLTREEDDPPAHDSAGARLEFSALGGWSVGGSYLASSRQGRWNHLGGFDGLWRNDRCELSGEFLAGRGEPDGEKFLGFYLQGVVRLVDGIYAIGRFEHFDPGSSPAFDLYDLGVAWRPLSILILKADYVLASRRSELAEPGLQTSLSVLF